MVNWGILLSPGCLLSGQSFHVYYIEQWRITVIDGEKSEEKFPSSKETRSRYIRT